MALHDGESRGAPAEGLALWQDWSRRDSRYQPNDCSRRWAGFKAGGGVTLGTLRQKARSHGWQDPHPVAARTPPPSPDGESGRPTIQLPHGTLEEEQLNKLNSDEGTLQYVDDCERWMIRYAGSMLIETYGNTKGGTSQRPYLLDHRGIWKRDDGHALRKLPSDGPRVCRRHQRPNYLGLRHWILSLGVHFKWLRV